MIVIIGICGKELTIHLNGEGGTFREGKQLKCL